MIKLAWISFSKNPSSISKQANKNPANITKQNPASYDKLDVVFLFYISLLLNTDFSNEFYVFFWCTTHLFIYLHLFIGFYKRSDSVLWGPFHFIYQFGFFF